MSGPKLAPNHSPQFQTYDEFFDFYLTQHSDSRNRLMHATGTVLGLAVAASAIANRRPAYALLWPVIGYGFAWTGHFLLEGNKPATFGHPFWSLISDFRMLGLMLTGRLNSRIAEQNSTTHQQTRRRA